MTSVRIPDSFLEKAARQFGDMGPTWVRDLPGILDSCIARWQLRDCVPINDLSINLVCFARSALFGDVVLKIQGPQPERLTEREALRFLAGRHACRMLDVDDGAAAFLMERIMPGTTLRAHPERDDQLRIGTEMIRNLPVPAPAGCTLPTYAQWLQTATEKMLRDPRLDRTMARLVDAANRQFADIWPGRSEMMVLHGDLHHDNILRAAPDRWLAIDPQGVLGPAYLEAGRFVQNHDVDQVSEVDLRSLRNTIAYVARGLGEPPEVIAKAFFVLHVLSICWDHEMMADSQSLAAQKRQCEELMKIVE